MRAREAGFTLIEALAAVAVMAVVLGALGGLAGQWLPQWRHGFVTLQGADLAALALDRIAEDVGSAEYARLDGGQGAPLFRGESEAVAFVRRAIGPDAGPRLEVVRIGVAHTAEGLEVQRARAAFAPGTVGAFRDAATLMRPPLSLVFDYAGADGQWRASWSGEKELPRAVRLSVRAQGGGLLASTAFALKVSAAPAIAAQPEAGAAPEKPQAK